MSLTDEYERHDATELAGLVRAGEMHADELLSAARELAAARNPRLNAIIRELPDVAARQLRDHPREGPFAGVPFLLKDLIASLEGTVMSCGSEALRHAVSPHSHEHVARCLAAGLVVFGKTNTPELGLMGITEPRAFGPTRNPWDPSRTPGGSSGGSAAAVAAGIVPMALGGDGGGSIRIPASCCGLFGFKPSRGLMPTGPDASELWEGAAVQHVLTRSVRDSARMLDATCGPDVGCAWPVPRPAEDFYACSQTDPRPLRIGFSTRSPHGGPVAAPCVEAVHAAARLLQELGHEVEQAHPPLPEGLLARAYFTMYVGQTAADVAEMAERLGVPASRVQVEPMTRALARLGEALPAGDYVRVRRTWNQLGRAMGRFHQRYDVWLTPTLGDVPQPVGSLYPSWLEQLAMELTALPGVPSASLRAGALERFAEPLLEKVPFTQLANLTGQPAMSVPLHASGGLPVGVQLVAAIGQDALLISLAGQLERARPWQGNAYLARAEA